MHCGWLHPNGYNPLKTAAVPCISRNNSCSKILLQVFMLWAAGRLPTNAPPRTGSAAGPAGPARALGAVHAPSCYFSLLLQHATLSLAVLSLSLIPLTRSSFSCTLSSLAAFFCLTDSLLSAERPPKILIPVQQFFLKLPEHWDFLLPQRLCPGCAPDPPLLPLA